MTTPAKAHRPYGVRNTALVELLARRDLTIDTLASMVFSGPSHLTQVLRGQRRGTVTWNKLRRVMTAEELVCGLKFANLKLADKKIQLALEGDKVVALQVAEPEAVES